MNRTGLFQGMEGKRELNPSKIRADALYRGEGMMTNRKVNLGYDGHPHAPATFSGVIDYSTRRGVMPCKGITKHVIRNPPQFIPQHGLMPVGGNGRTTAPSMANSRPLNIPILRPRSSVNAALVNPLGIPAVTVRS
tara:strand:+ start:345 stop:752 length:408 start_codon:yes stop_codon:yes gene_type:complete